MKKTLLALAAAGVGLYIGHISVATAHNIVDAQIAYAEATQLPTLEVTPTAYKAPLTRAKAHYTIDAYEDGSGVLYRVQGRRYTEIWTFDSDMLPWDCTRNGNATCGPNAPQSMRGPSCTEFFYTPTDEVIRYCTNGKTTSRKGNDADSEGEQIG